MQGLPKDSNFIRLLYLINSGENAASGYGPREKKEKKKEKGKEENEKEEEEEAKAGKYVISLSNRRRVDH